MNRSALLLGSLLLVASAAGCGPYRALCGDGFCEGTETAVTCPRDCGAATCGDGFCDRGESCGSCSTDCGSCATCGDRTCSGSESCSSCSTDCGACPGSADPYQTCRTTSDCLNARDTCVTINNGGVLRGMCTVTMCANDDSCDFDMFSARGDCLSFGGGQWDCYHRCLSGSDCYPGWGCFNPLGASGAIGNVCMPL